MDKNQYQDLFAESEEILQQISHILEVPPPPPELPKPKKKGKKRWLRNIIILFILLVLLVTLALAGGKALQTIGRYFPLRNEVEVNSEPREIEEEDLEQTSDEVIEENMAKVRVSLDIKAEENGQVGKVIVQNLPTNTSRLRFTVLEEDREQPLFRSEMILPGYGVYEIPLVKEGLEADSKGQILLEFYEMEQDKKIAESSVDINFTSPRGK